MPVCQIFNSQGEQLVRFNTDDFGKELTIGRASSCNISLKHVAESNVSREHIVLKKDANQWKLINQGHSGVLLNGTRVTDVPINDGDIFRFSQLFLCIGPKCGPSKYDVTWDVPTMDGNKRAVLWPGTNSIGASHDNAVTVRTEDVSRFHGSIDVLEDGRLFFENRHRSQYSAVNGTQVTERVEIEPGDTLTLGETDVHIVKGFRLARDAAIHGLSKAKVTEVAKHPLGWIILLVGAILVLTILFDIFAEFFSVLINN
ncbi:MAG: FHA domain-containing protein [Victivallales bacterium]|nr:FHA domain-containing protein [Victivallales bacterium]